MKPNFNKCVNKFVFRILKTILISTFAGHKTLAITLHLTGPAGDAAADATTTMGQTDEGVGGCHDQCRPRTGYFRAIDDKLGYLLYVPQEGKKVAVARRTNSNTSLLSNTQTHTHMNTYIDLYVLVHQMSGKSGS